MASGTTFSADPTIPYADNLQSYNRYSYVQNNPLSRTDPSGFTDKEKKKKKKHKVQSDTSSKSPTEKPTAQNQSTSSGVTGRGITADGKTKDYRGGNVPWHQKEIVPGSSLVFMGMNASHGAHGLLRSPYDMVVGGYHGVQGLGGFFGNLSVDPGGTWAATKASLKSLPQTIPAGLNRWSRDPTAIGSTIGQIGIGFGAAKAIQTLKSPKTTSTALSPYRNTRAGETFQHYSSVQHADSLAGGLRSGSYATTTRGLTGAQAQSGLALPHPTAPNAVYSISPPAGTPIRVNPIAAPKFGQPGGLPEVQFIFGTPPGSVSGSTLIP